MKYKDIITNVAKTLISGSEIDVTITTVEDLGEALFVVAAFDYLDVEYTIPFIFFNDTCIFIPFDWSGQLPLTAHNIFSVSGLVNRLKELISSLMHSHVF